MLMTRNGHADLVALMDGVKMVRGLAIKPAGSLYCYDPLPKSALRSALAPVFSRKLIPPERYELHWFHPIVFPRFSSPELGESYVAEFFWKHTLVPSDQPFRPPVLRHPPREWAPKGWKEGEYILVNATSGWKKKMWTVDGWTRVLQSLGPGHRFVLTHGSADWQKAHCASIATATSSALQTTTMREFLWLCANARAVLTVDGSASHLAAAFGVKCFTLFGPTCPAHWHRPAPGHLAFQAPADTKGLRRLRDLDAEPVIEALSALGL